MALINEFFSRYKTRIQKQVDVTSLDLMNRTDWINPIAPLAIYDDFKLLVMRSEMIRTIARIIGEGGEIPSSHRGSFSVPEYVLAKHANSIVYTETDMKRMHEWDRGPGGSLPQAVKDSYFGNVTQLVESIGDLATLLMSRVHCLGKTDFTDSLTQATVTLDYASTNANQYPAALAGGARWNQAATATPLQDLQSHAFYYRVTAAVGQPDGVLMNENTYENMISTDEVKTSVLADQGIDLTSVSLYRVQDAALNSSLLSRKIPPITLVNKKYQDENQANVLTENYFIPDGYYAFFWLGNAERALGPTVEADFSGGIYSASEELSQSPPIDRLYAVANGIPFIADARKLGGRQVY